MYMSPQWSTHAQVYMHTETHVHTRAIHMNMRVHVHVYTHVCNHAYTRVYTHLHTETWNMCPYTTHDRHACALGHTCAYAYRRAQMSMAMHLPFASRTSKSSSPHHRLSEGVHRHAHGHLHRRADRHVYRHVYRHVCKHEYRYVVPLICT